MRSTPTPDSFRLPRSVLLLALLAIGSAAHADKADRSKPMSIESSGTLPGTVDLGKRSAIFTGNVVITQGSLQIHAERVEVSEDASGQRLGNAMGAGDKPATFRQRRDADDEWTEGEALRIEYDSAANRVRFIGAAHLRLLKGTTVTDEAKAAIITYDTQADTIALDATGAQGAPNANGRTTVVFTPRQASAPKPAASAGGHP